MDYYQGCIICTIIVVVAIILIAFIVCKNECIKCWLNNDNYVCDCDKANTCTMTKKVDTITTKTDEAQLEENNNQIPVQVKTVTYPNGGQQITVVASEENNTTISNLMSMTNTSITDEECKELRAKAEEQKKDIAEMERMSKLLAMMENEKYKPTDDQLSEMAKSNRYEDDLKQALYFKKLLYENEKEEYKKPLYTIVDEVVERKFEDEKRAIEEANLSEGTMLLCKEVHKINKKSD